MVLRHASISSVYSILNRMGFQSLEVLTSEHLFHDPGDGPRGPQLVRRSETASRLYPSRLPVLPQFLWVKL